MKRFTVRLPEALITQIETESQRRRLSRSEVVRERLTAAAKWRQQQSPSLDSIADLIGSIDGLQRDLSARKKRYLKSTGYGDKHTPRTFSRARA